VVLECNLEVNVIVPKLMEHFIAPLAWDNVILYMEYVLNRNLIKLNPFAYMSAAIGMMIPPCPD